MLLGADTGFFFHYASGRPRAVQVWDQARRGEHQFIMSTLSIAEYLAYQIPRGTLAEGEQMLQELRTTPNVEFIPVSYELASRSARYRMSLNLATVDSIILTTFLEAHCDLVLTSDSDLAQPQVKNLIAVELLM